MYYCIVNGCYSDGTCLVSFHKLPERLCPIWKNVIGRGDCTLSPKKVNKFVIYIFQWKSYSKFNNSKPAKKRSRAIDGLLVSSVVQGEEYIFVKCIKSLYLYMIYLFTEQSLILLHASTYQNFWDFLCLGCVQIYTHWVNLF